MPTENGAMPEGQRHLFVYYPETQRFACLVDLGLFAMRYDDRTLFDALVEDGVAAKETAQRLKKRLTDAAGQGKPISTCEAMYLRMANQQWGWYGVDIVRMSGDGPISIALTDINAEFQRSGSLGHMFEQDVLTGLMNGSTFAREVESALDRDAQGAASGGYAIVYTDVLRFKVVNDLFGMDEGDRMLRYIGKALKGCLQEGEFASRIDSDHFAAFVRNAPGRPERLVEQMLDVVAKYNLPFETTFNAGIYVTSAEKLGTNAMIDRAILALDSVKGSYTVRYSYFTADMRDKLLGEHEIVGLISSALAGQQFIIHYQPQYSHATGMLLGAEALVRWQHPERGMIPPNVFIPIFERNGFITTLDLYVFDHVCALLRRNLDQGLHVVPVSTNISRYDIFQTDFIERLETIRRRYDVPAKLLCIELTESVFLSDSSHANRIIRQLHECGYTVQMDDFGSGYSSLNVLKDTDVDCFKLDMGFLSEDVSGQGKGGTILSSVVRMAKWLGIGVIAEGVETVAQADYLRSIGCDCVQGYLYAKPMPEGDYVALLGRTEIGTLVKKQDAIGMLDPINFWNPESQETLIFSNYVGGACIFEYKDGQIELLRVNRKYLGELGMNLSEQELIQSNPLGSLDEENHAVYMAMLERAIETGEEHECETWRTIVSPCCGSERLCIRASVRMIGRTADAYLFYSMIRNVTEERRYTEEMRTSEHRFKMASEQVNIYYWEYTVATREMRPCFRCMRDLGLPPLLTNYPESAFERGIFPPEVHDMYRSWHRQVAAGVPELEAIIPLTEDRIPFRVHYTTEFDENGRPIKAYGSAALVKDTVSMSNAPSSIASSEDVLRLVAQHSDRVVLFYDLNTRAITFNDMLDDQYGMNNRTIKELFQAGRILPESHDSAARVLRNIERGVPYGRERIRFKYRENYYCWLDLKYTTLFDEQQQPSGAFLSYVDITDRVDAVERSKHDGMTGLLNRATAEGLMRGLIEKSSRPGIMLLIDIDGLKEINDTYGHREGDRAILSIAEVLKGHFRSSDVLGRFGGDEFAIYLKGAAGSERAISGSLTELMRKIGELSVGPGGERKLHCSVGCAVQDDKNFARIYRQADAALYHAKRTGRNRFAFYTPEMENPE